MYESPIKLYYDEIVQQITEQRENELWSKFTTQYQIDCNKDELIKALQYDRDQYEKGYRDAIEDCKKKHNENLDQIVNKLLDCDCMKSIVDVCNSEQISEVIRLIMTMRGNDNGNDDL